MIAPEATAEGVRAVAAALREWLVSDVARSASGAFWAWLDRASGRPSFEYAEISGYALTYLASLTSLSPSDLLVGERAGAWLIGRLARGDLSARDGWDNGAVYLFDLAMIASGLLSFGRCIGAERLVESGRNLVTFLRRALDEEPSLSSVWPRGPASGRRAWSTHGRAHLGKIVQALLLDEHAPSQGAVALVESVKRLQQDDGRFETGPEQFTMLHPHLYAAEGLWIWGTAQDDHDALERARAAVEWAWSEQLATGGFPHAAGSKAPVEQSDVTAQALRLALVLRMRSTEVDRAAARLVELACPHGDGRAIVYQPAGPRAHLNTCATLFAAQALAAASPGDPAIGWDALV